MPELTSEILGTGAVGLFIIAAAIGNYLRTLKGGSSTATAPVHTIAAQDQFEQLVLQVKRIADALTDKNTANINDRLEALSDHIKAIQPRRRNT